MHPPRRKKRAKKLVNIHFHEEDKVTVDNAYATISGQASYQLHLFVCATVRLLRV